MRYLLLLIITCIGCSVYSQPGPGTKVINTDSLMEKIGERNANAINKPYPAFSAQSGNIVHSNESLKGKVVFINFWFAQCHPCIEEMDDLNKLYDKFSADSGFVFLSFTFDSPEEVEASRKKYNFRYPVFSVSRKECYRLNLSNGFPFNIILDRKGYIKHAENLLWQDFSAYYREMISPLMSQLLK